MMQQLSRFRAALAAAALAAAVAAAAASASAADRVLSPHDVARIRSVSSVAVSPDGRHIAYVLSVPRRPLEDEDGPAWEELHVIGPDGASRPFVTGEVNVGSVRFTPDGRGISFLARRGKDTTRRLYIVPLDGGEARVAAVHETDITGYAWSPDGGRVAFTARDAVPQARRDLEKKGFNQEVFEEQVPFVRVFVDDTRDEAPARRLDLPGSASALAWSPAGDRLAVALAPTPLVDDDLMRRRVHIVDVASGHSVDLGNPGKLGPIAWSRDGRFLAMVSGEDLNDPAAGRLLVAPAEGGGLRDVLPGYMGHVAAIAWKDADTIVYIGDEGVETVVAEVRRDGTGRRTLVPAGRGIFTQIDLAAGGSVAALVGESPAHPPEAFRLEAGRSEPQRLTTSNPWLAEVRLARQEVVRFRARDGLELEGILIHPLDRQPGARVPLILTVHGGPEAHDRNGWRTSYANPGQMAAARGFAVFYPNYRGSTGRGVAFSKLSQADPAGKEFDDLVDAVDHLVNIGLVDRARVGVTGGSYGGYATAWCATRYTDRFAAGVMFVGISDKISKVGTTDIPDEEFLVHARKRPWENWQMFLERSPIYHAGQSRTPLLILGGTDDPRVHPSQSLELYRYLKLHGKTVRLVRYPGEQHGNRRAASRLDYSLRLLQWMEHYLKGPGGAPPPPDIDYAPPKPATASAAAPASRQPL
jgi:dipeptidyl aminopeptidase/acylaminoacyl peptidase